MRLSADAPEVTLPPADGDWEVLMIDDLQRAPDEFDWTALCSLIRSSPQRRFVMLSRGVP